MPKKTNRPEQIINRLREAEILLRLLAFLFHELIAACRQEAKQMGCETFFQIFREQSGAGHSITDHGHLQPSGLYLFCLLSLLSGSTSAKYSSSPISSATHLATYLLSPVIIMHLTPIFLSSAITCFDSGRMISATAMAPLSLPSIMVNILYFPGSPTSKQSTMILTFSSKDKDYR